MSVVFDGADCGGLTDLEVSVAALVGIRHDMTEKHYHCTQRQHHVSMPSVYPGLDGMSEIQRRIDKNAWLSVGANNKAVCLQTRSSALAGLFHGSVDTSTPYGSITESAT